MKITKDTTLEKIIEIPDKEEVLKKHGVPCVTCPFAKMEMDKLQIGQVCAMYGLNLDKLLKDLNKK
jgi:hybrid cluster-associated redox disulfide protein